MIHQIMMSFFMIKKEQFLHKSSQYSSFKNNFVLTDYLFTIYMYIKTVSVDKNCLLEIEIFI